MSPLPFHGGDLQAASREFGSPPSSWQDLSTGISPWAYPVPSLPESVWQRLPGSDQDLIQAAAQYYGASAEWITPIPGSQHGIATLPGLLPAGRVALPRVGYEEHRRAWQATGRHRVQLYRDADELYQLVKQSAVEHCVLINPNNPGADVVAPEWIRDLHLAHRQRGLLLVDEAFADAQPQLSVVPSLADCSDLWVLRSVGKFFGLAGLRLGFLIGHSPRQALGDRVRETWQPWGLSHPALWVGERALSDKTWQCAQRARVQVAAQALTNFWQTLGDRGPVPSDFGVANGGLFVTLTGPRVWLRGLYETLAREGILLRWCHASSDRQPVWLRCGLPQDDGHRLSAALTRPVLLSLYGNCFEGDL